MPILNNANFEHACILPYAQATLQMEPICSIITLQHAPYYMWCKYAGTPVVDQHLKAPTTTYLYGFLTKSENSIIL